MNANDNKNGGVIIKRRENPFAQIPNATLRDSRLSYEATGLLAELLSHSDGWTIKMDVIRSTRNIGKTKLQRMFKELETFGYAVLVRRRDEESKQFIGAFWEVTDEPLSRQPQNQSVGKVGCVKKNKSKEEQSTYIYSEREDNSRTERSDGSTNSPLSRPRMKFINTVLNKLEIVREEKPLEGFLKCFRVKAPEGLEKTMLLSYDQAGNIRLTYFQQDPDFIDKFCKALDIKKASLYVTKTLKLDEQIEKLKNAKGTIYLVDKFAFSSLSDRSDVLPVYVPQFSSNIRAKADRTKASLAKVRSYMEQLKGREVIIAMPKSKADCLPFHLNEYADWGVTADCYVYERMFDESNLIRASILDLQPQDITTQMPFKSPCEAHTEGLLPTSDRQGIVTLNRGL